MLMLKSLLAWLVILGLAVANGAVRESVLTSVLGRPFDFLLSGVVLSLLVMLVAYGFVRLARGFALWQGVRIGLVWLLLAVVAAAWYTWRRLRRSG